MVGGVLLAQADAVDLDPELSVAEALPALYRVVLDALADLEWRGDRAFAVRLRCEAMATYARAWDPGTYRKLERVLERAKLADQGARRRVDTTIRRPVRPWWRRRAGEAAAR